MGVTKAEVIGELEATLHATTSPMVKDVNGRPQQSVDTKDTNPGHLVPTTWRTSTIAKLFNALADLQSDQPLEEYHIRRLTSGVDDLGPLSGHTRTEEVSRAVLNLRSRLMEKIRSWNQQLNVL